MRVPVLSLSKYSIRPKSSGIVLVRTTVPGMSLSRSMNHAYTDLPMSRLTRREIGTMVENKMRKRMTDTYHGLPLCESNPSKATKTNERASVRKQSLFVKELISISNRPVLDLDGDVDMAARVCGPVYITTPRTVELEARTVLAQAVLSMFKGADLVCSVAVCSSS